MEKDEEQSDSVIIEKNFPDLDMEGLR